ncbi:MAG: Asp23/Gls24 family envelope stress response protein [Anaerovoracaceae bacterium]|jgi:uncharacterized alkaline shock family protein YloU/adenylate kinase family enzyme
MIIYGLEGKSGTGKSYQAIHLCRGKGIEAIIDDGLFIFENRVLAGISAKRQASKIEATKTALFIDDEHCRSVREMINQVNPKSILILGTSERMVRRIIDRLGLPAPKEIISIESITTEDERKEAHRQRKDFGKHVIPAPTFQIRRQFSGYFLDPLRIFRRGMSRSEHEKTVVRPTYSYLGKYDLSDRVISDIVNYVGRGVHGINTIIRVTTVSKTDGVRLEIIVTMEYGTKIIQSAKELQKKVAKMVAHMTAFNVDSVDVEIRALK